MSRQAIHAHDAYPNWDMWQTIHGPIPAPQRRYSLAMLAIQAANYGAGLTLSSSLLALEDIREGRLTCPPVHMEKSMQSARWMVLHQPDKPESQAFADWITDKMNAACEEAAALIG